jgi:hypothetical protein
MPSVLLGTPYCPVAYLESTSGQKKIRLVIVLVANEFVVMS